jgi:hypothetical protein
MDKAKLLKARTKTEAIPVDGGEVKVRYLTRDEVHEFAGKEFEAKEAERVVLALVLVDPVLTEAEVGEWQKVAPSNEIGNVVDRVMEMNGMSADASKRGVQAAGE